MNIINNTNYTLHKIHSFNLFNNEQNQRVSIDVNEKIEEQTKEFIAIPTSIGYSNDESIVGFGDSIEAALNDCLSKLSKISWDELKERIR